jgi:HEAT repeat protein
MRRWLLILALVFCIPLTAAAQGKDDEPTVRGKTRVEWLKLLESSKEVKDRYLAVLALRVFGAKSAGVLDTLATAARKDENDLVRRSVVHALGEMGPDAKSTISVLAEALEQDKDAKVREAAAAALGKMRPYSKTAVLNLAKTLKDRDPATRSAAAEALRDLGEDAVGAREALLEAFQDSKNDGFTRVHAAEALARMGNEGVIVIPELARTLTDKDAPVLVRKMSAEILGRFGQSAGPAVDALVAALKGKEPEVRRAAIVSLGRIGFKAKDAWPAVQVLLDPKNEPDVAVRTQAIRVAGVIGREDAAAVVTALANLLKLEGNVEAKIAAVQELASLGEASKGAIPQLNELAQNDPRASVREAALAAVKKIENP